MFSGAWKPANFQQMEFADQSGLSPKWILASPFLFVTTRYKACFTLCDQHLEEI